jgi:hypothetical protein
MHGPIPLALRAAVGFAGALVLSMVTAAPAAAEKPIRSLAEGQGFVSPAGEICPFAVSGQPDEGAGYRITEFSDGRTVFHGQGYPTLTNLETGTSLVHHSKYTVTDTVLESGEIHEEISGQIFIALFEGDRGPVGVVGEDGALLGVNGHIVLTFDPETFVVTFFELNGSAIDLCALLA